MIKLFVSNGYFTLMELNDHIENFPYPQADSNSKPSIITPTLSSTDHKLNQEGMRVQYVTYTLYVVQE